MGTASESELLGRFWRELHSTRTGMLGLAGENEAHSQPMTAHFEGEQGPLWFYARRDALVTSALEDGKRAVFHYVAKDHDLYACIHGELSEDDREDVIDRFWSEEVARWFPDGQADSNLALLRFDAERAQIWIPSHGDQASEFRFGSRDEPHDIRATTSVPNATQ